MTHVGHLSAVEAVELEDIVAGQTVDNDTPVRVHGLLVVVGDDVGGSRASVLDLDATVAAKGIQCHGAIVVKLVGTVLP